MADIFNKGAYIHKMSPVGNAIDLRNAPISRLLLPFLLGILAGEIPSHTIREEIICPVTMGCWAGLYLFYRFTNMERARDHLMFTSISVILFMGAGYSLRTLSMHEKPALPEGQHVIIRGKALQEPVSTGRGWLVDFKMEILVHRDSLFVTQTKLKTYFRSTFLALPGPGEQWQLSGTLSSIKNRGNPGEVDYEAIMAREGYWYRFIVDEDPRMNRILDTKGTRRFDVVTTREQMAGYWAGNQESSALLRAVCLGDRSGLTDDQKQSYQDAGGMHLLAVSGLHIGLIWWILHRIMSFIVRLFRREWYRTVPIVLIMWCYAFLTGFSSSVCRAVTMFTVFSLAMLIDQRTHPLNCLMVSLFLIMVIDPGRITDVGLQLSYVAMCGIVTLFPWLRALPGRRIPNRCLRWVWEAISVSIAAQVSTAPLVVFYFHQLPVYALLTNLIAVPLLGLLIGLFVFTLPFLSLDLFTQSINRVMNLAAMLMNHTMEVIAGFPGAVLGHLNLDRVTLCILLLIWILGVMVVRKRSHWPRYGLILSVTAVLGWGSISTWIGRNRTSLIITHFNRGSQVIFSQGRWVDCYCLANDSLSKERMIQYLSTAGEYKRQDLLCRDVLQSEASRGMITACHPVSKGCWMVGNDLIRGMIITGIPRHNANEQSFDDWLRRATGSWRLAAKRIDLDPVTFIVLHDHPRIPSRTLKALSKKVSIIADGSNSAWYSEKMHAEFPQLHPTSQLGAYRGTW